MKPFLDKFISPQQFGFLKNRQIAEPISITKEILHSVKTKNKCALILKMDLSKAFDRVNWSYLRLILLQIGVPLMGVNWIMGCLTSANFALLVNGTPSSFFTASRGIRQGCPLSPLMFILVIEGLSLLIKDARTNGKIKGIKISSQHFFTHLLFVDDVILFGSGTFEEWVAFKVILDTFCAASGMSINMDKSCFLFNNMEEGLLNKISSSLSFNFDHISCGFKYLGYFIKPLGYRVKDWHWLIKNFERRIQHWFFHLLSLGGRLVLIKAVLSSLPVYWMDLIPIPISILDKLRSLIFSFLWDPQHTRGNTT